MMIFYLISLFSFIFINFIISPIIHNSQKIHSLEKKTKVNDRSSCVSCENDLENVDDKSQLYAYCNMHTRFTEADSGSHFCQKSVVQMLNEKENIKQMNTFRLCIF